MTRDIAAALVRGWTRLYTAWMDPATRAARRAEIESDLWEQRRAEDGDRWLAARVVARLLLGMPDDVRWRLEATTWRSHRRTALLVTTGSVVLAAYWMVQLTTSSAPVPPPLEVRWERALRKAPPPPPPPPPFCEPPGLGRPAIVPCTPWP